MKSSLAAAIGFAGGTFSTVISFRFSAKYTDPESGLIMYPYRPYLPALGRWLSRDPIGEKDSANLQCFVANAVVGKADPLGLAAWTHSRYWDYAWKGKYAEYVANNFRKYLGNQSDCADLTMLVLIDFASDNGLPLTFWHGSGCIYASKSCKFSEKQAFIDKVTKGIGSRDLWGTGRTYNTGQALGEMDIGSGDVYVEAGHAALVVNVAWQGALSLGQVRRGNQVVAKPGILLWNEHFANQHPDILEWIYNPSSVDGVRVDYLNHSGRLRPNAEIKYNRAPSTMPGEFRPWGDPVFSNYEYWTGSPSLASECR
jgi:RHS repeat-associated protein